MLARVKSSAAARLGALLHVDISGLMMLLGVSEEEGYRLYTLLHRGVQLTYALEGFMEKGVRIVTCFDEEYPPHFRARMGTAAPPALFFAGERALLDRPAVGGGRGQRRQDHARGAPEHRGQSFAAPASLVTALSLAANWASPAWPPRWSRNWAARSSTCPPAACSATSARSRCAALSPRAAWRRFRWSIPRRCPRCPMPSPAANWYFPWRAPAFIFNTDGKRGEADAIKRGLCDWVYAYTGYPGNRALVSRDAQPFRSLDAEEFKRLSARWKTAFSQQLNLFDLE